VIDDKLSKNKEERRIGTGRKGGENVQYSREDVPNPA
jgi:hypothetical protein